MSATIRRRTSKLKSDLRAAPFPAQDVLALAPPVDSLRIALRCVTLCHVMRVASSSSLLPLPVQGGIA